MKTGQDQTMMNKYVRKLLGAMFQSQQTQQIVRIQPQRLPTSEEWRQHWQSQGQSWRTKPEINEKRQEEGPYLCLHRDQGTIA